MTEKEKAFDDYLSSIEGLLDYHGNTVLTHGICECSEGWYPMIQDLISELIEIGWDKQIAQIKEKFGGLRFYIESYPEGAADIILKYSTLSYQTCEECGSTEEIKTGIFNGGSWIRTLCKNHQNV